MREGGAGGGGRCGAGRMKGAAGGERYVNMSQDGCKANNGNHVCGINWKDGMKRRRRKGVGGGEGEGEGVFQIGAGGLR